ncbi:Uncharacterised protein [BD1-7 clade bacterium]|uniref:Uncharacterized protein n=1 Tax=BD1-7 clade bacterium TaxID=2029982 RepID=A0A5S9QKV8_9GAMM|nr:Uncharacterised protein [BD1-7 clade bacterium]CAA0115860.1 Uncharacterised protein [BD1-7 clade bacterium]CAA0119535.1 Uncharacterised protein [BD1-7 clade bacterium]
MTAPLKLLTLSLLLSVSATGNTQALLPAESGQITEPEKDLYEDRYIVEMTVFTNEEHYNATEEVWPTTLPLSYPNGDYAVLESEDHPYSLLNTEVTPASSDDTGAGAENNNDESPVIMPLVLKDAAQKDYRNEAIFKKLSATHKHKVLFHRAWEQTLTDRKDARNIAITGGETIDHIPELAGTLQIYKARYLHIRANLWFTKFSPEAKDTKTLHWNEDAIESLPQMLESANDHFQPISESATTHGTTMVGSLDESALLDPSTPLEEQIMIEDQVKEHEKQLANAGPPPEPKGWLRPPLPPFEHSINDDDVKDAEADVYADNTATAPQTTPIETDQLEQPPTPTETAGPPRTQDILHIGKLEEARRMRSREMHYLDHPLFAIIIEIRPIENPDSTQPIRE